MQAKASHGAERTGAAHRTRGDLPGGITALVADCPATVGPLRTLRHARRGADTRKARRTQPVHRARPR